MIQLMTIFLYEVSKRNLKSHLQSDRVNLSLDNLEPLVIWQQGLGTEICVHILPWNSGPLFLAIANKIGNQLACQYRCFPCYYSNAGITCRYMYMTDVQQ